MKRRFLFTKVLSNIMIWVAGAAILSIVGLTVCDVILRRLKMPIDWCYEVVMLLGAIAIGFSLPVTTLSKEHVFMEFLVTSATGLWRKAILSLTRCLGIALFALFALRLFVYGRYLAASHQVTPTLEIPEYPIAYGIGVCCVVVCVVLLQDLLQTIKGVKP
jgi:TRAP-type C4-dicarboxylate transport system permease small subunit